MPLHIRQTSASFVFWSLFITKLLQGDGGEFPLHGNVIFNVTHINHYQNIVPVLLSLISNSLILEIK